MKKYFVFLFLFSFSEMVHAQLKVYPSYVAIGGHLITFKPANPGPEVGGYDGQSHSTVSFWHTNAGWNKVAAKNFNRISDSKYKTNIKPIENASKTLSQIKTYSYNFTEDGHVSNRIEYGVLADEVLKILPDLIDTVKDGLCLDYTEFVPLLIKAFNEQREQFETAKKQVEQQQTIIHELLKSYDDLEKRVKKLEKHKGGKNER